jgi:glycogen debranching enzyme
MRPIYFVNRILNPTQGDRKQAGAAMQWLLLGMRRWLPCVVLAAVAASLSAQQTVAPQDALELTSPAHTWEFLDATGARAGLFGKQSGQLEAWVYPLKILRNFHLVFYAEGHALPAESLARTIISRPESTTILYAADTFTVRETLFVPADESGAVISLDIRTADPMEVEARFERNFQLEWPAALAYPGAEWSPELHAFIFTCENPELTAMIGSPSAVESDSAFHTYYASSPEDAFRLGPTKPGSDHKLIVLAASTNGSKTMQASYERMVEHAPELEAQSAAYYRNYLDRTVQLELPDAALQQAYDWARVNMSQAVVNNPLLGKGIIAGYGASGDDRRPGFNWFFGRDALWTAFALNAEGDFATTKLALEFLARFQRDDGKIPHEVPQTASLIGPLTKTFFAYASADATPLYLIAFDDYVTRSGDVDFARAQWPTLEKTYAFLRSTFNADHLAQNEGVGHGWIEGGPLHPMQMEFYQAGLGVEAMRAWSHLALVTGHADAVTPSAEQQQAQAALEKSFWLAQQRYYAIAMDSHNNQVDVPSVLTTVPMWFTGLDEEHTQGTLDALSHLDHQTDWGMRILSSADSRYGPGGYHFGSIWPLFTGWASVAEYRNHRPFAGYGNLRANALLTFAGAQGHVAEVLSGDAHQPLSTSTPHQTWSSAMVIEPLLLGMFDLHVDAAQRLISLSPQLPANWDHAALNNIRLDNAAINLRIDEAPDVLRLHIAGNAPGAAIDFAPFLSPHARVLTATLDGKPLVFHVTAGSLDQQVHVHVPLAEHDQSVEIRTEGDLRISYDSDLPPLGEASSGARLVHQAWSADRSAWTLQFEGKPGVSYTFALAGASQIRSAEGADLTSNHQLRIRMPAQAPALLTVVLHLMGKK